MNDRSAPRPQDAMHPVHLSRKLFDDLADFARLSGAEQRFIAAAWALAPLVSASLARLGFDEVLRRLPRPGTRSAGQISVERGEELVRIAFRRHPLLRGGCLPESLTQYLVHAAMGPTAKLVVGVRKASEPSEKVARGLDWMLGAHAWIERDEGPSREIAFVPIIAYSARGGVWKAQGTSP